MASVQRVVVTVTIVLLIALVLFSPFQQAVDDHTGVQTVTNESVTASVEYNTTYELENYKIKSGETVYVENGSAGTYEVLPAADYSIDTEPGTINFTSAEAHSAAGDDVKITYDYQATSPTTTTILTYAPLLMAVLVLVVAARTVEQLMPR